VFYQTTGSYSDVKIPGILFDVWTIESYQKFMSALVTWLKTGKKPKDNNSNVKMSDLFNTSRKFAKNQSTTVNRTVCFLDGCNFTNVWSFLPAKRQPTRAYTGIHYHPCEKPLELMKRLVELTTPENALILDPFAGSGTTALACLETNREYIVIEREPEYYEVIQKRITQWHNDKLNATGTYELPDGVERIKEDKNGQLSLF
jgi:DNA modification methylase